MPGIFISYRRDDSQGEARHLFDDLTRNLAAILSLWMSLQSGQGKTSGRASTRRLSHVTL